MNWFLPRSDEADGPEAPAIEAQVPTLREQFAAGFTRSVIDTDRTQGGTKFGRADEYRQELRRELLERVGGKQAFAQPASRFANPPGFVSDEMLFQRLSEMDPAERGTLPVNHETFEAEVLRRRKAESDETDLILKSGKSWVAPTLGGLAAGVTDSVNIGLSVFGGPAARGGVAGAAKFLGFEMGVNVAGELANLPQEFKVAEELGRPAPDPLERGAMGAAVGLVLGGPVYGAARWIDYGRTRRQAEAADLPEGVDPLAHEAAVEGTETALREGREVPPPPVPTGAVTAPAAAPAPANLTDEDILRRIIGVESGGVATAQNPNSTARGLGQFIESTWLDMIRRHRPDLAQGRDRASQLALRDDPAISAEMTRRLIEDNRAALAGAGAPTDPGVLYLAHFMGSGGAIRALRSDANTPVQSLMNAQAIAANAGIRHNGKSFAQFTAADLRAWASAKMGRAPSGGMSGGFDAPPRSSGPSALRRGQTAGDEVTSPSGMRAQVEYRVVDPDSLRQATGELQNRDRAGRVASDEQVASIAANLDPSLLMPGPFADQGAPVVGPDGIIESGNGRVRALATARAADRDGQSVIAAVRDALGQGDMFNPGPDPALSEALIDVFYPGNRARGAEASGAILRRYAAEAMARGRPDSPDMIDGTPPTRDEARADVFDYIERFYNPRRRHSKLGYLSPMEFEARAMLA